MQTLEFKDKERIERFMEEYWPLSEKAKEIERRSNDSLLITDFDELERLAIEADKDYRSYLNIKYGENVIDEWKATAEKHPFGSWEGYHALNSLLFKNGLCNEAPISTVLRSRAALKSLLNILSNNGESETIIDYGSGDGRIALGCALYLDNVERVYTIDLNENAHERMEKNIDRLKTEWKNKGASKIIPVNGDYISGLDGKIKEKADLSILAFSYDTPEVWMSHILDNLKEKGRLICYYPMPPYMDDFQLAFDLSHIGFHVGLSFEKADSRPYWFGDKAVGCIGRKAAL